MSTKKHMYKHKTKEVNKMKYKKYFELCKKQQKKEGELCPFCKKNNWVLTINKTKDNFGVCCTDCFLKQVPKEKQDSELRENIEDDLSNGNIDSDDYGNYIGDTPYYEQKQTEAN